VGGGGEGGRQKRSGTQPHGNEGRERRKKNQATHFLVAGGKRKEPPQEIFRKGRKHLGDDSDILRRGNALRSRPPPK